MEILERNWYLFDPEDVESLPRFQVGLHAPGS
jgi:hypothetical protein